ncbi:helicase-associated domain-containing protein [Nocardioides salsibiostraticola]
MGTTTSGPGYRSLADQLRDWSDAQLSRLLLLRPDLATPAPHDFGQLASRASVRASLWRALDSLSRLELSVLDALVVAGQTSRDELLALVHAEPAVTHQAIETLIDLGVAWESTQGLRPLTGVAEGLTGGPARGVSALRPRSPEPGTPAEIQQHLSALSPRARAMLDHVDTHGGEATAGSARLTVSAEDARTPAEELIARRLLVPRAGGTVVIPGEVGLTLRGGHTTREPVGIPPGLATADRPAAMVDRAAAGAAFEFSRRVELLLDTWSTHPPAQLRSGGLGVRDLKATAQQMQVSETDAALLIETAAAAGLLAARADADGNPVWVPTDTFDTWSSRPTALRWLSLVTAWRDSPRAIALIGTRDSAGKTWNALAPDLTGHTLVESRRMALEVMADPTLLPPGQVLAAGTGVPSLVERISWQRPRRHAARAQEVADALDQAATLGLVALGGLASYAREGLDGETITDALTALLPTPVDHVLIQADLTAVAPGPLESDLARRLQLLADVESQGGATVYRFAATSLRRALDAGWTAAEIHEFLGAVSRTPVPQPLAYLVDDTVRTFGSIRVGHAEAFLRADDESTLAELLGNPKAASLGLRRIAPTVLISSTPLDVLLPRLREIGAAPVVEAADGTVQVTRPDVLRARSRRGRPSPARAAREEIRVASTITAIRSGERAAASSPARSGLSPSGSLAALRNAIESGGSVLIGYVDNHGSASDRIVDPLTLDGGQLTAHDHRADDTRSYAVHRITSVRPVDTGPETGSV